MTAELIAEIDALARVRRGVERQLTSAGNRLGGQLRGALGFRTDLPDKEREVIVKRSQRIQKAVLTGKPIHADDAAVAANWAGVILATEAAKKPWKVERAKVERQMEKAVRKLPAYPFVKSVRGFGDLGFAIIIARCRGRNLGGLSDFPSASHVWSKLGLAPTDDAQQHAIGGRARADVFAFISQWLVAAQTSKPEDGPARATGHYGAIYLGKKAEYMQRVVDTAHLPMMIDGKVNEEKWTPLRADKAARRYMAKRLLRDLWRAWRAASVVVPVRAEGVMPPAKKSDAA